MREYDLTNARWRSSSYSNGDGGNRVEVADGTPGPDAWRAFIRTVEAARF